MRAGVVIAASEREKLERLCRYLSPGPGHDVRLPGRENCRQEEPTTTTGSFVARVSSVRAAFELLVDHPLLGGLAEDGRRELVLSRGRHGYIAKQ